MTLISSSRATIAAGTSPPRVMQTTAWNGPDPDSRHASARASRWNWSHETGNAFSGVTSPPLAASPAAVKSHNLPLEGGQSHVWRLAVPLPYGERSPYADRRTAGEGANAAGCPPHPASA